MGSDPGSPRRCHVLIEDADLAEVVPSDQREQALDVCTAPLLSLPIGPWSDEIALPSDGIGLLILSGLVLRRLAVDQRFAVELLGECDIVRPWQQEDAPTLTLEAHWIVLEPIRLALLDRGFARRLGQYPELAGRLFERAIRRSRRLVVNMAIVHQARVDDRLHLLFWHLAGRWGRVRGDGVLLPLRLTHAVLADLVAARRPTVTSALSDLSRRGLVRTTDDGWLLIGEPPEAIGALIGDAHAVAARPADRRAGAAPGRRTG